MSTFIEMLSYRKGDGSSHRPKAGDMCMYSGPNCDNDEGYTYVVVEVLWTDSLFIVTRVPGCWPTVAKWEHVRTKPIDDVESLVPLTTPVTGAVVVAVPVNGIPNVSANGKIFDDAKAAQAYVIKALAASVDQNPRVSYAVATIGVVDGRKA